MIIGGFGSGITNVLLNLKNHKLYFDKIYLYAKDPYEAKYKILINKREGANSKHCDDFTAFTEHSNDIDDIYGNIEDYNPNKKR